MERVKRLLNLYFYNLTMIEVDARTELDNNISSKSIVVKGVDLTGTEYDSIPSGYYHKAMLDGKKVQRFWHRNKFREVISRISLTGKERLLDLGCGPGTLFSLMPKNYGIAVGVDISEKQIAYAKKNFKNAEWRVGRIEDISFDEGYFNYAFMIEVLEHIDIESVETILKSVNKILRKGGKLLITTPNSHSLWPAIEFLWNIISEVKYEKQHVTEFNRKKLKDILERSGFKIVESRTIFVLSPFVALLSPEIAEKVMEKEGKIFRRLGALQITEAVKE